MAVHPSTPLPVVLLLWLPTHTTQKQNLLNKVNAHTHLNTDDRWCGPVGLWGLVGCIVLEWKRLRCYLFQSGVPWVVCSYHLWHTSPGSHHKLLTSWHLPGNILVIYMVESTYINRQSSITTTWNGGLDNVSIVLHTVDRWTLTYFVPFITKHPVTREVWVFTLVSNDVHAAVDVPWPS